MKARKLPSGSWRAEIARKDENGKRTRKSFTAATKAEAEAAALAYKLKMTSPDSRTVGEAVTALIESKRPVLSPSTIRSYMGIKRALEKDHPTLWQTPIERLTEQQMQQFINKLAEEHKPKTVRNYVALIGASLPPRMSILTQVTLPARVRPDYHIPTEKTVQAILEAVSDTDLEIPVLLAVVCTMRAGEIAALRMEDITGTAIHVHRNMVRNESQKWVIKSPKTYSSDRIIEAPAWLIAKIRKNGLPDIDPSAISYRFGRMLKANGLPHCRFHDLRHYSASYMHAKGVPTAYIMKRGGWNTETVLNAVYRHALDDRDKIETQRINDAFTESLT